MEFATFILILCLALILTIYNRRQARALEYVARLEEDRAAREIRDRRGRRASELRVDPLRWMEQMVNPLLDTPLSLVDAPRRVIAEVEAVELRASDGRRLVISTQPPSALRRYDRRSRRASGRGARSRLTHYATVTLLGGHWRIWNASRTMAEAGEFFDLEASACGKNLGLNWGTPARLWFYVLPA